jgi:hypothetical protein
MRDHQGNARQVPKICQPLVNEVWYALADSIRTTEESLQGQTQPSWSATMMVVCSYKARISHMENDSPYVRRIIVR